MPNSNTYACLAVSSHPEQCATAAPASLRNVPTSSGRAHDSLTLIGIQVARDEYARTERSSFNRERRVE